jgi:hypothetical protein
MLSMTTHVVEGTKALAVGAAVAAVLASAAYVAQADLNGTGARMAAETARKIGDQHKAVCQRLGHADNAAEHTQCLGELMRLKQWHDDLSAAQNESIL